MRDVKNFMLLHQIIPKFLVKCTYTMYLLWIETVACTNVSFMCEAPKSAFLQNLILSTYIWFICFHSFLLKWNIKQMNIIKLRCMYSWKILHSRSFNNICNLLAEIDYLFIFSVDKICFLNIEKEIHFYSFAPLLFISFPRSTKWQKKLMHDQ